MRSAFQFSIRSLLILTLVVAAYFAGWKSSEWKLRSELDQAMREARQQEEVARMNADMARYQAERAALVQQWARLKSPPGMRLVPGGTSPAAAPPPAKSVR